MQAQVSNGFLRELVAERDHLKMRNLQLSESLDACGEKYKSILRDLGYDEHGQELPKKATTDSLPAPDSSVSEENEYASERPFESQEDPVKAWANKQAKG